MPPVPIVDAHVHLWDPQHFRIPWLDDAPRLNSRHMPQEFREATDGLEVAAMVYLEVDVHPAYCVLEPQWIAALARDEPRIQAIVAYAPLEHGDRARAILDAFAGEPLVKGIRRIYQGEADLDFCLRPDFVRGVQLLPEYNLSFDICINHRQLAPTVELVRRAPETQFMLDHIAKPDIKQHLLDPWRTLIAELAASPNVMCKVSGMVTEADHESWTPEDLEPYVTHVLQAFGEDRVAFGGDWPVSTLATSYRGWVETLDQLTAHLSPEAKRKLWADNARRFYRM